MPESRWRRVLAQTRQAAFGRLAFLVRGTIPDQKSWEELEQLLLQADVGVSATQSIVHELRSLPETRWAGSSADTLSPLRSILLARLQQGESRPAPVAPEVVVLVGVNGSGKTTAAARLGRWWLDRGKKPLLAAADTFRAAADEQLALWAERVGVPVITGQAGSDPAAVAYNASQAALARGMDVLIIDTSGRMHTSRNLMAELGKICRVTGKVIPGAPHQVLLVLDATTGQNGLAQARSFKEAVGVTGVFLAKLDHSARGGVALAVSNQLGLPIVFAGFGEGPDDIAPFDAQAFVDGLLATDEETIAA